MKITITETKEVEVKWLQVNAHVRYWEDSEVNGKTDDTGSLMPLCEGDCWCPMIDIETGIIKSWPKGVTADVHYKVCDDGEYHLLTAIGDKVKSLTDSYVPDILCPEGGGYGDYIIMKIDGKGQIENWIINLTEFTDENED